MDYGGWYDHAEKEFTWYEDIIFLGAMTPTSGSNVVTSRYIRHYNTIYL